MGGVFGPTEFRNEITWKRTTAHSDAKQGRKAFGNVADTLLFYGKSDDITFHHQHSDYDSTYRENYSYQDEHRGHNRLDNKQGGWRGKRKPSDDVMGVTRYWRYRRDKMQQLITEGRIIQTRPGSVPQYKRYFDESPVPRFKMLGTIFSHNLQEVGGLGTQPETGSDAVCASFHAFSKRDRIPSFPSSLADCTRSLRTAAGSASTLSTSRSA